MDTSKIIQSQYLATLAVLEQVTVICPEALWNAPGDKGTPENIEFEDGYAAHYLMTRRQNE